jgi:phosphatidylglycerol:prolipoprotein diacylglycerol transferase
MCNMIDTLQYIVWNPAPTIFKLGPIELRWYAMCWLTGLLLAYFVVKYLYKDQKVPDKYFDPLFLYCFIGILAGARLGHCLFYEPDYFLSSGTHIVEMFLPIRFLPEGGWRFTGYAGLASHGGTIGIMLALYIYCRNTRMNLWQVVDNIGIATPITACFIRLGNLMNSEIIGKVTDVPWAFIFEKVDPMPRHPGQLYEALAYAVFFFISWYFYKKHRERVGTGFFFGLCLTLIFTFRFFIEFTKDIQVDFEAGMLLDMGQLLSIPFIIIGVASMVGGKWMQKLGAHSFLDNKQGK